MDSDSNSRSYKNSRRRSATKRVSFSIIEGGITFDEIAKMRQMKEKELDNFIAKKNRTNQYISSLKHNIISPSNFHALDKKIIIFLSEDFLILILFPFFFYIMEFFLYY